MHLTLKLLRRSGLTEKFIGRTVIVKDGDCGRCDAGDQQDNGLRRPFRYLSADPHL